MTDTPVLTEKPVDVAKPDDADLRLMSVTTIIGVLDKPALVYWSAEQTALAAVAACKTLAARVDEDGEEEVVRWLTGARFRRVRGQRTAAELGTAVHAACEEYALTGVRPDVDDEVRPFLDQFDRWAQAFQPKYHAAEMTVFSPHWGYAGTLDAIVEIDGVRLLLDYKTSRKSFDGKGKPTGPYPEVALQMSAYRWAEMAATWRVRRWENFRRRWYLLSDDERQMAVPVPEVDGAIALHLSPEHATAYPVRCDEQVFDALLWCLEATRWATDLSKTVIGEPLVAPR